MKNIIFGALGILYALLTDWQTPSSLLVSRTSTGAITQAEKPDAPDWMIAHAPFRVDRTTGAITTGSVYTGTITAGESGTISGWVIQQVEKPEPPVPALTEVERLQFQNKLQALEIWHLKTEDARKEFEKARTDFERFYASLQKEGFTLDAQTLAYTPKKPEEKK